MSARRSMGDWMLPIGKSNLELDDQGVPFEHLKGLLPPGMDAATLMRKMESKRLKTLAREGVLQTASAQHDATLAAAAPAAAANP